MCIRDSHQARFWTKTGTDRPWVTSKPNQGPQPDPKRNRGKKPAAPPRWSREHTPRKWPVHGLA
eukprot:15447337-Alexandrium_andersonii.AAC.1